MLGFKKLFCLCLLTTFATSAFANVYPNPRDPKAKHFIKIESENARYSFKLCLLSAEHNCKAIGKKFYSVRELALKESILTRRLKKSNRLGIRTLGFSLFFSSYYYYVRKTIQPKNLIRDITLSFEDTDKDSDMTEFTNYLSKLETALYTED